MKNPNGETQKKVAYAVAKYLAVGSFIFQVAEPFIVESHNLKGTSLLTLMFLLTFGAFYLVTTGQRNKQ